MKKVYEVEKLNDCTYRIDECGRDNCYLLLGSEKALLIDCSIGSGDIKAVVSEITSLPVTVAATHTHGDHSGAGCMFGEIFVPAKECNFSFKMINSGHERKRLISHRMKKNGITGNDISGNAFKTKWLPYSEGKTFELGGRTVTAVSAPGHSPDGMVFLDSKMKMMFTGDAVGPVLLMKVFKALSLEAWISGAKKILALSEEYTPWGGHSDGRQSKEQITQLVKWAEEIVSSHPKNSLLGKKATYPEFDKAGCIIYDTSKVHG